MSYKLVAIDCDNTLINSTAHIPQKNIDIIQKLQKKGIKFILATGRNDILVKDYVRELNIKAPVIGCNGATIRNLFDDRIYKLQSINKDARKEVFEYCTKNNIPLKLFTLTTCYSSITKNESQISDVITSYTKKLSSELVYMSIDNLYKLIDREDIYKIVIIDYNMDKMEKIQNDLKISDNFEIVRSARNFLDIIEKGVSKGNALKEYAETLGISQSDIVAFGDSENDYQMLKFAGLSVAMENGEQILKDIADMITLTNDEAGVAQALIKIFNDVL